MKKLLLLFCFAFALGPVWSQTGFPHRLKDLIVKIKTDTLHGIAYGYGLPSSYIQNHPDSGIYYAKELIRYGTANNDRHILASGLNIYSYALYNKGNYPAALNMAFQSLKIIENSPYAGMLSVIYNLVGNIYKGQQNYPKALYYYRRSKQSSLALHNKTILSAAYFNMAFVFEETNVLDSALYYSGLAVKDNNDATRQFMGYILSTLGDEYLKLKNYKKALGYYQAARRLDKKNADFKVASITCISLAKYYALTGKPDSSIYYAQQALYSAKKVSYNKSVFESADLLAHLYEAKHQPDSGLKYLKLSSVTKDSLYNAAKSGEMENLTTDEFLRQNEIQAAQKAYQNKLKLYALIFGLLVLLIAALLQWRNSRQRKKAYNLLQQQNEEIEAQKTQAMIETALERVRAKTMAMQKSDELLETSEVLFQQLRDLGETADQAGIAIVNEKEGVFELFATIYGNQMVQVFRPKIDDPFVMGKVYKAWKAKKKSFVIEIAGEELRRYNRMRNKLVGAYYSEDIGAEDRWVVTAASFSNGVLSFSSSKRSTNQTAQLLERFAAVFDSTYTRFLDLQKAEAQAREANIEASLERVRTKTMAMHNSQDVADTVAAMFDELVKLGIEKNVRCGIGIINDIAHIELWTAFTNPDGQVSLIMGSLDMTIHPLLQRLHNAWKNKEEYSSYEMAGDDLIAYYRAINDAPDYPTQFDMASLPAKQFHYDFFFPEGTIFAFSPNPLMPESIQIFKRFTGVFGLTYRRYLDMVKAEAHSKEAQIELAMERIRARAMAMHSSGELMEVANILREQMGLLGQPELEVSAVHLYDDDSETFDSWYAVRSANDPDGKIRNGIFTVPKDCCALNREMITMYRSPVTDYTIVASAAKMKEWFEILLKAAPVLGENARLNNPGGPKTNYFHFSDFGGGSLVMASLKEPSKEVMALQRRAASVLDLAYQRFLDLKKAEAQARESQIQLGLERVRARAMAMQSSGELAEVVDIVFKELTGLDFGLTHCAIAIADAGSAGLTLWQANSEADQPPVSFYRKSFDHPYPNAAYKEWKKRTPKWVYHLKGAEKRAMHDYYASSQETMYLPNAVKEGMAAFDSIILSHSFNNFGYLRTDTTDPLSEDNLDIVYRFANVFDLCYTRFTDIKQAEAQAHEAQIQLALERVRARTMAMQRSEELAETATVLFQQLYSLDVTPERVFIGVPDDRNRTIELWGTEQGGTGMSTRFEAHADGAYSMSQIFEGWEDKKTDMTVFLSGEYLDEHLNYVANIMHMPVRMELVQDHRILYCTYFSKGMFVVVTPDVQSEETLSVLRRFAAVFDQTYTRFLDLQKAEAQARESQIQLGLERVRAAAMAMHNSNDVGNATALVFSELYKLGITTIRCGVCIVDGATQQMEVWSASSSQEGGVNRGAGKLDMTNHPLWIHLWNAWKQKKTSFTYELKGRELADYYKAITNAPGYHAPESYISNITPDNTGSAKQYCNCFLFNEGCVFTFTQAPFSSETSQVLEKFTAVFGLTYRRYLDLVKAEAQAREAQIEAALERVRSRTMAMQKSDELKQAIQLIYEQLIQLNFNIDVANFAVDHTESNDFNLWLAVADQQYPAKIYIPYFDHPIFRRFVEAKEKGIDFYAFECTLEEKDEFFNHFFKYSPQVSKEKEDAVYSSQGYAQSTVLMKTISLAIINYAGLPYSEAENIVLRRFGKVFEQTYTRFLDLQQAEAQAREAKIEAGLERVRAKAMSMQTSEELNELIGTVFGELTKLDVVLTRCLIMIFDPETKASRWWMANSEAPSEPMNYLVQNHEHDAYESYIKAWDARVLKWQYELKGKVKKTWDDFLFTETELSLLPEPVITGMKAPEQVILSASFNNFGCLTLVSLEPLSDEHFDLLLRFAKVFDMSYTRFNDLQKAEAQAREARIEAALERVRSKTMAMHNSDDIDNTAITMFDELVKLGVETTIRCGISIIHNIKQMELWTTASKPDGTATLIKGYLDLTMHPLMRGVYEAWKKKETDFSYVLVGDDLANYYRTLSEYPDYPFEYKDTLPETRFHNAFFFPEGMLYAFTDELLSADATQLFKRFAGVFGLTYRRFLDLQKAEAQAREARIEAALEKVRGKAMAMYNSKDLSTTASMVFTELRKLGLNSKRCGVALLSKNSRTAQSYVATSSGDNDSLDLLGTIELTGHPSLEKQYRSWLKNENYFDVLKGDDLKSYKEVVYSMLPVPDDQSDQEEYGYFLPFSEGFLFSWTGKPFSENEITILTRFKNIIDLTFRRYIELKKSEASAREAIKQASLDRVRAQIASMRSTSDLQSITPLVWNELTTLGVPFIRCGVFIVDEQQEVIHSYLSTPDGKAIAAFQLPFNADGIAKTVLASWRKKQFAAVHWNEDEFKRLSVQLVQQGAIASEEKYLTDHPPTSLDLHFLPFLQGMLYAGNTTPLSNDEIELVQSLADAFSTAYARYEDFNKLEAAKQEVEQTLTGLKAAQTQLIQSEKMASLGELTAGIAHEIQNPLNFVNNFSEVNQEMLEELKAESIKPKAERDEQLEISLINDLIENEQKINHHGKRADSIVKGMLQHSRTSTGEKQLTNINVLADEFFKLSYHGLRAKDKSFNAEMVSHYDPDLPRVNVVQQDIGRVLLNLFNNAFYAVSQKQKSAGKDYKPEVTVTTSAENGQVVIKVKDNGIGIPEAIKDKILQPFFTTKPTGEGTGLGLSLTYDMVVKGHGGSINIESEENKGSVFTISIPVS